MSAIKNMVAMYGLWKAVRVIMKLIEKNQLHKLPHSKAVAAIKRILEERGINPDYYWLVVEIIQLVDRLTTLQEKKGMSPDEKLGAGIHICTAYAPNLCLAIAQDPEGAGGFLGDAVAHFGLPEDELHTMSTLMQQVIWYLDDPDRLETLKTYRDEMITLRVEGKEDPIPSLDRHFFPNGLTA